VRGRVTKGGAAAAGLWVGALTPAGTHVPAVRTRADGSYALFAEAGGPHRMFVQASEAAVRWFERTLPERGEARFDFDVPSGALRGRVLDGAGRPLAGVGVSAVLAGASDPVRFGLEHFRRTRTAEDGSFAFGLLAPGRYTLRAPDGFQLETDPPRVPHGRAVLADLELGEDERAGLELRLPAEARVRGQVLDASGAPAAGVWVGAMDEHGRTLSGSWEARTLADGAFELASLPAGTLRARADLDGLDVQSAVFVVAAGETARVTLELPPAAQPL
jgi:hypothetical protein